MEETNLIFGIRAVIEALRAGKKLDKILIQRGLNNELFAELKRTLKDFPAPFQFVPPEKLKKITSKNHQGVIAFLSVISYHKTEDLLPQVFEKGKVPLLLILDKVTDVRNFGAIARSAECCGVDFIVIPTRGSAQINADAMKTSAGALHRIPVCREDNLKDVLDYLKESGIYLVACHEKTSKMIHELDLKQPLAVIMGSEEDGISAEYSKRCDEAGKIPMSGSISSLNVSVATGVFLYEVTRQRLG